MSDCEQVKRVWRSTDCVCFDVDSTVCTDEAIDELAAFLGVGGPVAELTRNAMQGSMTYKQSFTGRLDLMQPSNVNVQQYIASNPPKLTIRLKELIECLHKRSIPVYLISGGFTCIIEKVAELLNIPKENIFANKLMFFYNGQYAGFDERQPTCESGGKPRVIQQLKDTHHYQNVVHVGDGATDMEACPPADAFIGFGGNIVRDSVKKGADWFVYDFQEMIDELS